MLLFGVSDSPGFCIDVGGGGIRGNHDQKGYVMPMERRTQSRREFNEKIERQRQDLDDKGHENEEHVSDVEVESQTLDEVDLGNAASEDAEAIEEAVETSRQISTGEFDEGSRDVETIQEETREFEDEIRDRAEALGQDLQTLHAKYSEVHSESAKAQMERASQLAEAGMQFMEELAEISKEAMTKSQDLLSEHRNRVGKVTEA